MAAIYHGPDRRGGSDRRKRARLEHGRRREDRPADDHAIDLGISDEEEDRLTTIETGGTLPEEDRS